MKERQEAYNYKDIVACGEGLFPQHTREIQQSVVLTFDNFFIGRGYRKFAPEPILPQTDNSILFTNSTIVPLKSLVEERRIPNPGCFVIQPCLRNQNLQIMHEDEAIPEYMNYFTMLGTLAFPGRYGEVAEESWELLTQHLNIPRKNIKIFISSQDKDMLSIWQNMTGGPIVEVDSKEEGYYEWSYGMPGVSGRGLTFSIRFKDSGIFRDIGNIITMKTRGGEVVGYEFGFGVETILSRMFDLTRPIEAATISKIVFFEVGLKEKLADAIACVTVLYRHGLRPGRGGARHILKAYIKGISYLRRGLAIDLESIRESISAYEQLEFGSSSDAPRAVIGDLVVFESKLELFRSYVRSQFIAHAKRNSVNTQFFTKLRKRAKYYGLPSAECGEIIKELMPSCYLGERLVK